MPAPRYHVSPKKHNPLGSSIRMLLDSSMGKLRALSPTKKAALPAARIEKVYEEEHEDVDEGDEEQRRQQVENQLRVLSKAKEQAQPQTQTQQQQLITLDDDSDAVSESSSVSSESVTMTSFKAFTSAEVKRVLVDFDREAATHRQALQTHQRDLLSQLERRLAGECESIPPYLHNLTLAEFASYGFNLGKASRAELAKHMLEDMQQSEPSPKRKRKT